jgi:hypothetical protein
MPSRNLEHDRETPEWRKDGGWIRRDELHGRWVDQEQIAE